MLLSKEEMTLIGVVITAVIGIVNIFITKGKSLVENIQNSLTLSNELTDKYNAVIKMFNSQEEGNEVDRATAFNKLMNILQCICEFKLNKQMNDISFEKFKPVIKHIWEKGLIDKYYNSINYNSKDYKEYYINIEKVYNKYCKKKQGIFCKFTS